MRKSGCSDFGVEMGDFRRWTCRWTCKLDLHFGKSGLAKVGSRGYEKL